MVEFYCFFKNSLNVVSRTDFANENFQESIWCDLQIEGEKTLRGLCYRPTDSNRIHDKALFNYFHQASKEKVGINYG